MSRARYAMHLFTDSKVALREAVTRPSKRLSPWELVELGFQPTRSLKQQFSRPSEVWEEHAEPVFRFCTAGDCWAFPFFSLDSRCQRSEGSWISMLRVLRSSSNLTQIGWRRYCLSDDRSQF